MSRIPSTPCTRCDVPGVRAKMRKDGEGFKHWPSCTSGFVTPPGEVIVTNDPTAADILNASANAASSTGAQPVVSELRARVLAALLARTADCTVMDLAEELDEETIPVFKVLHALQDSGEAVEIPAVRTETKTSGHSTPVRWRAARPASTTVAASPRKTRKGTVAADRARTCKVCKCTGNCDMGRITCTWMESDTPKGGDTCLACAELIDLAEERIRDAGNTVSAGLTASLFDDSDMPCLGEAFEDAFERLGAVVAVALARVRADDAAPPEPASPPEMVQRPLVGLGAARNMTLPFDKRDRRPAPGTPVRLVAGPFRGQTGKVERLLGEPHRDRLYVEIDPTARGRAKRSEEVGVNDVLAVDKEGNAVRGSCPDCGTVLERENSSRLSSGAVMHVGCPTAQHQELAILQVPCPACGAAVGEACMFASAEPASWAHPRRHELLPAGSPEASQAYRRGLEDKVRALIDHYAALPHNPPLPTEDVIVRALKDADPRLTPEAVIDVIDAIYRLGELEHWQPEDVPHDVNAEFYRRKPGCVPIAMGRVGQPAPAAEMPLPPVLTAERALEEDAQEAAAVPVESPAEEARGADGEDMDTETEPEKPIADQIESCLDGLGDSMSDALDYAHRAIALIRSIGGLGEVSKMRSKIAALEGELEAEKARHQDELVAVAYERDENMKHLQAARDELSEARTKFEEALEDANRRRKLALAALEAA